MRFSAALVTTLFLPVLVNAEHGYSTATNETRTYSQPSAAPTSTAPPVYTSTALPEAPPSNSTNINVLVAPGGQFTYSPSNFTASNGTVVTFFFPWAVAHSVTQGSFASPCVYLAPTNGTPPGFDSGLQTGKQFSIKITDDQKPIWFFCKLGRHCGLGMVGAINAPTTGNNTFDAYLANAKALGSSQTTVSDSGLVTGGVGAEATATPVVVKDVPPGVTVTGPPNGALAAHLVANGFLTFLAAVFGITLM